MIPIFAKVVVCVWITFYSHVILWLMIDQYKAY
jgi:hypothetical protein